MRDKNSPVRTSTSQTKEPSMDSNKRPDDMVRITTKELADKFIEEQIALIRQQVGSR